jgi:glycosyltransferase involved in cell wall biosynthesis
MSSVSVVIPALNEEENIAATLAAIPVKRLRQLGHEVEMLVVDNGSVDRTGEVARRHGARVLVQPVRGYGNAYQAGFANSTGDIIATGDADLTYPFEIIPEALEMMERERLDFLSTNRLVDVDPDAMSPSHILANRVLSGVSRFLHHNLPFQDSQSGMWIFRRVVWNTSRLVSGGMPFSQEIKLAAFRNGFRCGEMPIEYRPRGGEKKLRSLRDGAQVAGHIVARRLRADWTRPVPLPAPVAPFETAHPHPLRREPHRPTVSPRLTESHHSEALNTAEPAIGAEPEAHRPNTGAQL